MQQLNLFCKTTDRLERELHTSLSDSDLRQDSSLQQQMGCFSAKAPLHVHRNLPDALKSCCCRESGGQVPEQACRQQELAGSEKAWRSWTQTVPEQPRINWDVMRKHRHAGQWLWALSSTGCLQAKRTQSVVKFAVDIGSPFSLCVGKNWSPVDFLHRVLQYSLTTGRH
jgi:hypothetical protein